MPEEHDKLEVLARVRTEVEATLIVEALAERDIMARAVGGFTSSFRAEAPGDVSVLVRPGDLARARIALDAVRREGRAEQAAEAEQDEDTPGRGA